MENNNSCSCRFCKKLYKNSHALTQHELRCKLNSNALRIEIPNFNSKGRVAWNKGLTKQTNDSIKLAAEKTSKKMQGKSQGPLSEEHKKKISKSRKKYLEQHPEKVPYRLNHSSKISYPEQYFIDLFEAENIDLKYHLQISKYELDFYNEEKKLDLEIDGEQHYVDPRIAKSDIDRDIYMTSLGWTIKRIRWSEYKKLTLDKKVLVINEIKDLLR